MAEVVKDTQGGAGGGGPAGSGQPAGTPATAPAQPLAQSGGGAGAATAPQGTPVAASGAQAQAVDVQAMQKQLESLRKQVSDRQSEMDTLRHFQKQVKAHLGDDPLKALESVKPAPVQAPAQPSASDLPPEVRVDWEGWAEQYFGQVKEQFGRDAARTWLRTQGVATLNANLGRLPGWVKTELDIQPAAPAQPQHAQAQQTPTQQARQAVSPIDLYIAQQKFDAEAAELSTQFGSDWLEEKVTVNASDLVGPQEPSREVQLSRFQALKLYCASQGVGAFEGATDLWAGDLIKRAALIGEHRGRVLLQQGAVQPFGSTPGSPVPRATPVDERKVRALEQAKFGGTQFAVRRPDHAASIEFPDGVSEGGR